VHVEDILERVAVVRQQVRTVCVLCALVQVVVLLHQPLQLRLHVGHLVGGELVLVQGHLLNEGRVCLRVYMCMCVCVYLCVHVCVCVRVSMCVCEYT